MKIKKLTAYLLMSGMILGTMSSDLYTIKAQAVETIEETEDKTPENETPQIPETPEQPETEPENEEVTEAAPVGEIELSAEQFPDQVILTFAGTCSILYPIFSCCCPQNCIFLDCNRSFIFFSGLRNFFIFLKWLTAVQSIINLCSFTCCQCHLLCRIILSGSNICAYLNIHCCKGYFCRFRFIVISVHSFYLNSILAASLQRI